MRARLEYNRSNIKTTLPLLRADYVIVHARKTVKQVLRSCTLYHCRLTLKLGQAPLDINYHIIICATYVTSCVP